MNYNCNLSPLCLEQKEEKAVAVEELNHKQTFSTFLSISNHSIRMSMGNCFSFIRATQSMKVKGITHICAP